MASTLPGELLVYDYRPPRTNIAVKESLKILQWNVERNYESDAILAILKKLDADVLILQEVDIGCRRSENRNHMQELCKALQVKGGFVCEFIEIDSPIRQPRDEGGGIHGNAILSKYDIEFRVIEHKHHGFDWDHHGDRLREPRIGRRYTLSGIVRAPGLQPMLCYCVHLEVFTGIIGRVSSFVDVFRDSMRHADTIPHQIIFGDLNTMAHSIARLPSRYACDRYRYLSLGETESSWWDRRVFAFHVRDGPINTRLATAGWLSWIPWSWIKRWPALYIFGSGFSLDVLQDARNPGFYDPWPPNEATLENPGYFGLYKAKLDWTLLRCMQVIKQERGNNDYKASDHAYLMVEVIQDTPQHVEQQYLLWKSRRRYWQSMTESCQLSTNKMMAAGVALIAIACIYRLR